MTFGKDIFSVHGRRSAHGKIQLSMQRSVNRFSGAFDVVLNQPSPSQAGYVHGRLVCPPSDLVFPVTERLPLSPPRL
jgi:hypothetical protein